VALHPYVPGHGRGWISCSGGVPPFMNRRSAEGPEFKPLTPSKSIALRPAGWGGRPFRNDAPQPPRSRSRYALLVSRAHRLWPARPPSFCNPWPCAFLGDAVPSSVGPTCMSSRLPRLRPASSPPNAIRNALFSGSVLQCTYAHVRSVCDGPTSSTLTVLPSASVLLCDAKWSSVGRARSRPADSQRL
jgi:hypothetical protein